MRFSVSVPVLSEPIRVVLPSVSTAGRRRTIALRCAMRRTPSASATVKTTGSPSGTAATARAAAISSSCTRGLAQQHPEQERAGGHDEDDGADEPAQPAHALLQRRGGDVDRLEPLGDLPQLGGPPVATTTPRARPLATVEPVNAMPVRSPSPASASTRSVPLTAGTDSPVSRDSSISSAVVDTSRRSAGTRMPDSSTTRSPGTTSALSISHSWPSRTTRAVGLTSSISASTERSALRSWYSPIDALSARTAAITAVSTSSPSTSVSAPASRRMTISGLVNCRANTTSHGVGRTSSIRLGP
jgi:hypothetical protein